MNEFDELVEQAAAAPDSVERLRLAAKARKKVVPQKKRLGAPSRYSERLAATICEQLANGQTLTKICDSIGIAPKIVYEWLENYPDFRKTYLIARESMSQTLIDRLVDESEVIEPDKAIAHKVKAQVYQWVASRYNPTTFSDSRRLEIKGEVNHRHTHELLPEQKKRIAESWLISQYQQDQDCLPGAVVSTVEPDGPSIGPVVGEAEPPAAPCKKKALVKSKPVKSDDW
jgi:hypothetical protein